MDRFIIGLEITKLSRKIVRALEAEIVTTVDENMSATTARIICCVVETYPQDLFQKDIEELMGLNRSSVSLTLNAMEKNEFITRESISDDGRYKSIKPTEKALFYHEKIAQAFDRVEEKMKIGVGDLDEFAKTLSVISENLED